MDTESTYTEATTEQVREWARLLFSDIETEAALGLNAGEINSTPDLQKAFFEARLATLKQIREGLIEAAGDGKAQALSLLTKISEQIEIANPDD